MELKNVTVVKEDKIAIVTINRPKAMNALNSETLKELEVVFDDLSIDDNVLTVILTGEGKAFVAGADIAEMKNLNAMEGRKFGILGNKVFRKIESMEKPVIAAVNGFALGGGCEIAMSCDIRIASTKAKFGQPEVGLGITPGFGGTQRLARHVGLGMAKELIFTAAIIRSDEALRIGLVNKVVEPEALMEAAKTLANTIAGQAPIAVKLAKAALNKGMQCGIDTAIAYESEVFGECFATEDQVEGMNAFLEKREKSFKNK
jgi:enoyl-CoA hydratase